MRTEDALHQQSSRWKWSALLNKNSWWLFCLGIVLLKLVLYAVDRSPRFYGGDSLGYIASAITGRASEDLPYVYSCVVRWLCNSWESLTPLMVVQVLSSAGVAIVLAWTCRAVLFLSTRMSYLFGLLCSIDPVQLALERYLTPETFSLLFYALVLHQSLVYLQTRRLTTLLAIQVLALITMAFRAAFVIPFQIMAVALPLIAFSRQKPPAAPGSGDRPSWLQLFRGSTFWRHFATSTVAMFFFCGLYRQANGCLLHREPAYLYGAGYTILSAWAPALRPEDSADVRLAGIIREGSQFSLTNDVQRHAQRYAAGHLIDRWRRVEPDGGKAAEVATRTAINAFRRDPAAIITIAAKTYYAFWKGLAMERIASRDLAGAKIGASQEKLLMQRYHWRRPATEWGTSLIAYYVAAAPYYFGILLLPLLSTVLLFIASDKRQATLLFAYVVIIFSGLFLFALGPNLRSLQPLSLLTLLSAALAVKSLYRASSPEIQSPESAAARATRVLSRGYYAVLGVIAAAALLRIGLAGNQPLWNDEVFSLAMATGHSLEHSATIAKPALGDFVEPAHAVSAEELGRYIRHDHPPASLGRVARAVFLSDTSPPLYYVLLSGWTLAFGTSDFVLRQFSIICSLACFPFLAGIARLTAGRKAVLPACLLFAFSPLAMSYATEARMYSLLWLCVLALTWLSLVWRNGGGSLGIALVWAGISAAGFLTHYFFAFPWTALVVFLLVRPGKLSRKWLLLSLLLTASLISPWYVRVPESMTHWRITKDWPKWEPPEFSRPYAALSLVLQNFSGAGHHTSSNVAASCIFGILAALAALRVRSRIFTGRGLLLWLLFAAPIVGVLIFDLLNGTYTAAVGRYAIAALPMACLLAGAGLAALTSRTRTLLLVCILLAWVPNLLNYEKTARRQTARHRAEVVRSMASPSDLILIDGIPSGLLSVVRYLDGAAPIAGWMPDWVSEPATRRPPEWIFQVAAGRSRIWWVGGAGSSPAPAERDWLREHATVFYEMGNAVVGFRPPLDSATF